LHLELNHHTDQVKNIPESTTYVLLSADNAGVPQEDTHPDHSVVHDNWSGL